MSPRILRFLMPPCASCRQRPGTDVVDFGDVKFKVCADCRGLADAKPEVA